MYAWAPLGCGNYAPNFFGTSVPEVVEVRENPDGTVTLTVNAVCDMVICDDALITHDLTVKFKEEVDCISNFYCHASEKELHD